jgi:hypothetical protein
MEVTLINMRSGMVRPRDLAVLKTLLATADEVIQ